MVDDDKKDSPTYDDSWKYKRKYFGKCPKCGFVLSENMLYSCNRLNCPLFPQGTM